MRMKSSKLIAASLACLGMLVSPLSAAPIGEMTPSDVVLQEGNVLIGQVVDAQGVSQPETTVTIANHQAEVASVKTDEAGRFSVSGLQGGVYRVAIGQQQGIYRVWAPNTAPPVAQKSVMMVVGQDVVRGQYGYTPGPFTSMAQWCADHPIFCAAAIGAAIAIPIAVADDDDPAST